MHRLTWAALCVAFVAWLVLAVLLFRWGVGTLRFSWEPAPSVLEQVSGVVLYREVDQRNEVSASPGMQLFDGDELTTSFGSTAVLRLFDDTRVELYPDTRVRVEAAHIGRFNAAATEAVLAFERGAARVTIPPLPEKPHRFRVTTSPLVATLSPGAYTLRAGPEEMRISAWDGRAEVQFDGQTLALERGKKLVFARTSLRHRVIDVLENIVANGSFVARFEGWEPWDEREQGRPDVPGRMEIEGDAGAPERALRVWRHSLRDAHNETGVRQRLDRDVTGARAIVLEARVRVDYASLSGGGYLGSEYPMMIRLRARDRRGSEQVWTQGFYYANPENRPTPRGRLVPQGEWVEFRFDLTEALGQVATIESIEVSGAGHTFDASITNVRLLVD